MRSTAFAALALATVALACGRPGLTANERGIQEDIVRDRVATWARHLNNQALDSLTAFYDTTPRLIAAWPDGTRAIGWEQQRIILRDMLRDVATLNLVVSEPAVQVLDWGVAVAAFRFSADLIYESDERDLFAGHGTQVWIRDRDAPTWHMLVSQLSRSPAAAAMARRP